VRLLYRGAITAPPALCSHLLRLRFIQSSVAADCLFSAYPQLSAGNPVFNQIESLRTRGQSGIAHNGQGLLQPLRQPCTPLTIAEALPNGSRPTDHASGALSLSGPQDEQTRTRLRRKSAALPFTTAPDHSSPATPRKVGVKVRAARSRSASPSNNSQHDQTRCPPWSLRAAGNPIKTEAPRTAARKPAPHRGPTDPAGNKDPAIPDCALESGRGQRRNIRQNQRRPHPSAIDTRFWRNFIGKKTPPLRPTRAHHPPPEKNS